MILRLFLAISLSLLFEANAEELPVRTDPFLNEACDFSSIKEQELNLRRDDFANAKRILNEIHQRSLSSHNSQTYRSAHLSNLSSSHPPYDSNRAGRSLPDCYINGSEISTPRQQFLLFECPRQKKELENFFNICIAQKISVIVSLTENGEPERRCHDFWLQDSLKQLHLRSNWAISNISHKTLAKDSPVQLIETILEATDGIETRTITHMHYDGWKDFHTLPSYPLMSLLLDRIKKIQPPDTFLAIHCKAGIGRSAVTALSYYLEREVDYQLSQGVSLDKIRLNIPEALLLFRLQRAGFLSGPEQFADVYTLLSLYYDQLSTHTHRY